MFRAIFIFVCLGLMLALGACSRVDPESLPPVPRVRFDTFLPGVQAQLTEAYADVDKRPVSVEANGHLAMLLQTYKQFSAADTMYARTRILAPDEFQWSYLHGIVQSAAGQPDAAITSFRTALGQTENYPMTKIRLAELLAGRGDVVEADALYDDVLSNAPPMSEAFFSHGKFLLEQERYDQSIAAFKQAIRMSGNLGAAYYQMGLAYRAVGERELAQQNFALAKKHEGYSADSSDRYLNKLLPLNLSETPFVHRAKVLAESGRLDEAARFIQMALERNPDSVAAHASMLGLAATRGDFAAVDEHFEKAVAVAPRNAKVYFNLGMARIAEKRLVEAERAFAASIERDGTDPNAHVKLATLRHQRGKLRDARRHLERALELDPAHQAGNWLLGELELDAGDAQSAVAKLSKAAREPHPLRPMMLGKLAQAHARLGELDQAQAAIDRALDDLGARSDANQRRFVEAVAAELDAVGTPSS